MAPKPKRPSSRAAAAPKAPATPKRETSAKAPKKGRPTAYTPEIAALICDAVALGSNLNVICSAEGMPDRTTVYGWLRAHADFSDNYARARETRADSRADRLDEIAAKVEAGLLPPDAARVIVDTIKWQAGKENPKRYGDKLDLTVDDKRPTTPEERRARIAELAALGVADAPTGG